MILALTTTGGNLSDTSPLLYFSGSRRRPLFLAIGRTTEQAGPFSRISAHNDRYSLVG